MTDAGTARAPRRAAGHRPCAGADGGGPDRARARFPARLTAVHGSPATSRPTGFVAELQHELRARIARNAWPSRAGRRAAAPGGVGRQCVARPGADCRSPRSRDAARKLRALAAQLGALFPSPITAAPRSSPQSCPRSRPGRFASARPRRRRRSAPGRCSIPDGARRGALHQPVSQRRGALHRGSRRAAEPRLSQAVGAFHRCSACSRARARLCLDLGASPGGWSWVLHRLGARVISHRQGAARSAHRGPARNRAPARQRLRARSARGWDRSIGCSPMSSAIPRGSWRWSSKWLAAGTVPALRLHAQVPGSDRP